MINLNNQVDHILYQIFKSILSMFLKITEKILIKHQYKYMKTKLKIGIHLKLKMDMALNFLILETMNLFGSTESKITKDKNSENAPHLEITEVVLVHYDIVMNDYQQDSKVLYTFVPNKPFGSLLETSPTNQIFLKTINSEYDKIKTWFADQNSQPLEIR